jgi:hypothetical protein
VYNTGSAVNNKANFSYTKSIIYAIYYIILIITVLCTSLYNICIQPVVYIVLYSRALDWFPNVRTSII